MKMINLIKIRFFDEYFSELVAGTKVKKYVVLTFETETLLAREINF